MPTSPRRFVFIFVLMLLGVLGRTAAAQNPPPPEFAYQAPDPKPPEKPAVEWKVQAKGGLLVTSGNSKGETVLSSLDATRQGGANKLSLNLGWVYGRSDNLVPILDPTGTTTVGYGREGRTSTNEWKARGRYDRFLTANNAAYVLAQIGGDRIAGKELYGGGQAGYSRQLVKNEHHTLVAELGYDLSFERYVQPAMKVIDGVTIHSARVFAGELFTITKETGLTASAEALFNLNKEQALKASDTTGNTKGVAAFSDTRLVGKVGLTTILHKSLSFGFTFTVKYDQNPAPRPLVSGAPPYAADFQPFSDKVDTLTEATLLYTFL